MIMLHSDNMLSNQEHRNERFVIDSNLIALIDDPAEK